MDSFYSELYQLAGYSTAPDQSLSLLDDTHVTAENNAAEITSGYSCVFNWASMKYTYMSDSVKKILGYDKSIFFEQGFNFSLSIIHPADLEKLKEIHLAIFGYYYRTPAEQRAGLQFSYNFRIKASDNAYVHILRQSTFTAFTVDGKPTLEYINSTDITSFAYRRHITLTVHKLSALGTYVLCYEYEFSDAYPSLTEREKQVLELVRQGLKTREIATKLYLSIETIKSHRKNIIAKTGAGNMTAAINRVTK